MCDDVDSILYVQHKKLIVRRLYFRFENCEEKIENDLDVTKICRYFAAALMKDTLLKSKVLKKSFSKKSFKKIWRFEKLALPLHHFPTLRSGVVTEMKFRTKLE